jgi:hypothetical protein
VFLTVVRIRAKMRSLVAVDTRLVDSAKADDHAYEYTESIVLADHAHPETTMFGFMPASLFFYALHPGVRHGDLTCRVVKRC